MKIIDVNSDITITTMIREGISINNVDYPPMGALSAISLYGELCEDCRELLKALVTQGLEKDFMWQTAYSKFNHLTRHYAMGSSCKHCVRISKPVTPSMTTTHDKVRPRRGAEITGLVIHKVMEDDVAIPLNWGEGKHQLIMDDIEPKGFDEVVLGSCEPCNLGGIDLDKYLPQGKANNPCRSIPADYQLPTICLHCCNPIEDCICSEL